MGARWYWSAVCLNLHVYSNFSGGADACYICGEDPEVEYVGDVCMEEAETYRKRRLTKSIEEITEEDDIYLLFSLGKRYGYKVTKE